MYSGVTIESQVSHKNIIKIFKNLIKIQSVRDAVTLTKAISESVALSFKGRDLQGKGWATMENQIFT